MNATTQPLKLLVVEDSARDFRLLQELLEESGAAIEITRHTRVSEAVESLKNGHFDCVLLDLGLPDGNGTDSVGLLRAVNRTVAIVVLTGRDDDRAALDALRRGAQEYAVKGAHDGEELLRVVLHAMERHKMVSDLDSEREREYLRASHDTLTGLPNRQLFMDRARVAINQADRGNGRCGLCFLDLDGFKQVNDAHGHAVGDELLKRVALVLKESVRANDTVARLGGDEFLLLLTPIRQASEAETIVKRIISSIAAIDRIGQAAIRIGASAGLAHYPENGESLDQLTAHADHAMYEAKRAGKGVLRVYGAQAAACSGFNATSESSTTLRFQPWQEASGSYGGLEVFIRKLPGEGSAQEVLTHADGADWFENLGCSVLRRACGEWKQLSERGLAPPRLSVNAAESELTGVDFAAARLEVMRANGFHPSRLQIEIAETLFQNAGESLLRHLHQLRAAGVWIAMDNIGRGSVSLRALASLPLDALKLDPSVLISLRSADASAQAWVTGLSAFARQKNLPLMFTGVETDADRRLCAAFGHVGIQGHWLALPVSAESLASALAAPPRMLQAA